MSNPDNIISQTQVEDHGDAENEVVFLKKVPGVARALMPSDSNNKPKTAKKKAPAKFKTGTTRVSSYFKKTGPVRSHDRKLAAAERAEEDFREECRRIKYYKSLHGEWPPGFDYFAPTSLSILKAIGFIVSKQDESEYNSLPITILHLECTKPGF